MVQYVHKFRYKCLHSLNEETYLNHIRNKKITSIADTLVLHFTISNKFVSVFRRNLTLHKTHRNTNYLQVQVDALA